MDILPRFLPVRECSTLPPKNEFQKFGTGSGTVASSTLRRMKRQIFSLLPILFFTATLCACATESSVKPEARTTGTQQLCKEPAVPAEAAPPAQEGVHISAAPVKPAQIAEAVIPKSPPATSELVPSTQQILAFARAQLPKQPIRMNGSLKERAENGFVKKELTVEMDLNWGADPANATYRIRDEKTGVFQTLEILWLPGGAVFKYSENNTEVPGFNPDKEIAGLGVTWADLSFSFLWSPEAETLKTDKKMGKDCFVISVPRGSNRLLLWIEQETGRVLGAKEETADGAMVKEIKVVSVKEFDKLWMVKDLDIIRPSENSRTTLRINNVEPVTQ
jgi:hypothetical protein